MPDEPIPVAARSKVSRHTSLQGIQHMHTHTKCCRITDKYNKVINILPYSFSKERCALPEERFKCFSVKILDY
jgi:hypothetical protein